MLIQRDRPLTAPNKHFLDQALARARVFDTIDHSMLMARVKEKVSDGQILTLIEAFLDQRILDSLESWVPEQGTPQGAVISPLLANIFLDPLDRMMAHRGYEMVRYADDFVILCRSEAETSKALEVVETWIGLSKMSTAPGKAGLPTSNTATAPRTSRSIDGYAAITQHLAQTAQAQRTGMGTRSSTLAKCLLCRPWAVPLSAAYDEACRSAKR